MKYTEKHVEDTKKRLDVIGDLEDALFKTLAKTTDIARELAMLCRFNDVALFDLRTATRGAKQLALLCRLNETLALRLANARGEESSSRLCTILALEAAARRKGPKEKDVSLPGRRARKGEKRGSP